MSDHVYKSVEVTGSSAESIDDAVRTAVAKASQSLRHLDWFEVSPCATSTGSRSCGVRGHLEDGQVSHFQVTIKRVSARIGGSGG
jgi:flavin-binding protein dodecin